MLYLRLYYKIMKYSILLVALTVCFVTESFGQPRNYNITNGFGVFGGITKFDIQTDNFTTMEGDGVMVGMSAMVDIPHKWYNMSYGMQMAENYIHISARPAPISSEEEFIKYKVFTAQVALLMHIKPFQDFLTIDVGPMFQYNGKMELKDTSKESYYINNYANVTASDITRISQFNFNGAVGATVGIKNFKIKAQYIYGFTNILKKLNSENTIASDEDSFKGNQTQLVLGAMICF